MNKDQKYDKIFTAGPGVVRAGLEAITGLADKKEEPERHLVVIPDKFIYNWQKFTSNIQEWDFDGVEAFQEYISQNNIRFHDEDIEDHPLMEDMNLYLRIVKTNKESRDLSEIVKEVENQVKNDVKNPNNFIVLSTEIGVQSELTLHGFNVEQVRHRFIDPDVIEDYIKILEHSEVHEIQAILDSKKKDKYPSKAIADILKIRPIANQYIIIPGYHSKDASKCLALRYNGDGNYIERNIHQKVEYLAQVWQPKAKNSNGQHPNKAIDQFTLRQSVFADLAYDPTIEKIVLAGGAGTGKTSLAYATLFSMVIGLSKIKRRTECVRLLKSVRPGDREEAVGYLPGALDDKLKEDHEVYETIHQMLSQANELPFSEMISDPTRVKRQKNSSNYKITERVPVVKQVTIKVARSNNLTDTGLLVDEIQNFPPRIIRDVCERQCDNSLFVFCGDPAGQFDNKQYGENYNSVLALTDLYYDHPNFAAVMLKESHRSKTAKAARDKKIY